MSKTDSLTLHGNNNHLEINEIIEKKNKCRYLKNNVSYKSNQ